MSLQGVPVFQALTGRCLEQRFLHPGLTTRVRPLVEWSTVQVPSLCHCAASGEPASAFSHMSRRLVIFVMVSPSSTVLWDLVCHRSARDVTTKIGDISATRSYRAVNFMP